MMSGTRKKSTKPSANLLMEELLRTYTHQLLLPRKPSISRVFATYMRKPGLKSAPVKRKHTRSGSERTIPTSLHSRTNSARNAEEVMGKTKTAPRLKRTESTPNLLPPFLLPTATNSNPYRDSNPKPVLVSAPKPFHKAVHDLLSRRPAGLPQPPPNSGMTSPPSHASHKRVLTIESPKFLEKGRLLVSPIDMSPAIRLETQGEPGSDRDTTLSHLLSALQSL